MIWNTEYYAVFLSVILVNFCFNWYKISILFHIVCIIRKINCDSPIFVFIIVIFVKSRWKEREVWIYLLSIIYCSVLNNNHFTNSIMLLVLLLIAFRKGRHTTMQVIKLSENSRHTRNYCWKFVVWMNKVCSRKKMELVISSSFMSRSNFGKLWICHFCSNEARKRVGCLWSLIMKITVIWK